MTAPAPSRRRVAVYAGTFDPPTRGHLSVVERAARLFDEVVVLCAVNPGKRPLFSPADRVAMLADAVAHLTNVRCDHDKGFVVAYARRIGARYLVRGVRGATDAHEETRLAAQNHGLAPEVETVFLPADPALSEVSSSRLKEMALRGEDLSGHCTPAVAARLVARLVPSPAEAAHV
jgi:pantetheine-phosphate adenylyltransferase